MSTLFVNNIKPTSGGKVNVSGSGEITGNLHLTGGLHSHGSAVFNESSADNDFRVESNDETHMFFLDGGNNRISIGDSEDAPSATLEVTNHASAGATGVPLIQLNSNDVDQIALDINSANTTANVVDIVSDDVLTSGKILNIDVNNNATTALTQKLAHIDFDKDGVVGSGVTSTFTGLHLDMADAATNHGSSTLTMTALDIDVDSASTSGTNENVGIDIVVTDATTNSGIKITAEDGAGADIKMMSSADTGDYASIAVGANGATTITTVDDDAAAANLTFTVDGAVNIDAAGDITLDADGGNIILKDGATTYLDIIQSSGNCIFSASADTKDIIFHGDDAKEVMRIDSSAKSLLISGSGGVVIAAQSAPGTPTAGHGVLYVKEGTDAIHFKNDGGTEFDLTSGTATSLAADNITVGDAHVDLITTTGGINVSASAGNIKVDAAAGTLTLDGHTGITLQNNSNDITIDSAADIILDAGGADILFKDDGTLIGGISNSSLAMQFSASAGGGAGDLIFQTGDGASEINFNTDTIVAQSANSQDPLFIIKNTTNDANGARLQLVKDKGAAGAANDVNGLIQFVGDDANQDQVMFSEIKSQVKVHTNGQEGGKFTISVAEHDGTSTAGLVIEDGNEDGELDVTIGAGANSIVTIPGDIDMEGDLDVNGTANLDNTDIDGTLVVDGSNISLDSTSTLNIDNSNTSNGVTINTATSGGPISIGHTTSETTVNDNLTVTGDLAVNGDTATFASANSEDPLIIIKNTTNDANGARLRFVKDKGAAGADADIAGLIEFYADDDNQDQVLFAKIQAEVADASDGAEGGRLLLGVASHDGEMNNGIVIEDGNVEDEVDVIIGNGAASLTTIVGDLAVNGDTTTFSSANSQDPLVIIKNTTNDANGARLQFVKDKGAAGADGDDIGVIEFIGDDTAQAQTSFAKILVEVAEADNTDEAGKMSLFVAESDGTTTELTAGIVIEGMPTTNGVVNVDIGAGTASKTKVKGELAVEGLKIETGSTGDGSINPSAVSGTNTAGKSFVVGAGVGTGNGMGGTLKFQTASPGGSGSSANTAATVAVINGDGFMGVGFNESPEATLSIGGGYHIATEKIDLRAAHSGDNTVIAESKITIPANAIITEVGAVVETVTNLGTHKVNVFLCDQAGLATDATISNSSGSPIELVGAGASGTVASDSSSAVDIDMTEHKNAFIKIKEVRNTIGDAFVYIGNAGTGNGTTNSTAGTLFLSIKYFGMD